MRIYSLKRTTIPKIAVLATGLTAAILAATINPAPAQAYPTYASTCTPCHTAGGSVSATPSSATPASGAAYTVALAFTGGTSGANSGYWISGNGVSLTGGPAAVSSYSVAMTAPAAAGTYTYLVWMRQGVASSKSFSITVGAPPTTTPPPTTTTTTPPPTTTTTTTPPPTTTRIRVLSPRHGDIGTKVTIHGSGFGTLGAVQFGTVAATASSWTDTKIVFEVPDGIYAHVVPVTVTPMSATASNAVNFRLDWDNHHGDDAREQAPRHHVRLAGDFD